MPFDDLAAEGYGEIRAHLQRAGSLIGGSAEKHAKHFRDVVVPAMSALRETGDQLEVVIPHETWPLATYREMLFIK